MPAPKVKIGRPKKVKGQGTKVNMSGLAKANEVMNSLGFRTVVNKGKKRVKRKKK